MNPDILENKKKKAAAFDPNGHALDNGQLFGLPFTFEESAVAILPVPWEVTVSYHHGTSLGPEAVLRASAQVDLYDPDLPDAWKYGIYMLDISKEWLNRNNRMRPRALEIQRLREKGEISSVQIKNSLSSINQICRELEDWVYTQTERLVHHGKLVGILGGEHSVSLGFMKVLAHKYENFGILQIDAHADLRKAYEGFEHSHASVMYNALAIEQISKIVQVGIRDYCQEEADRTAQSRGRIVPFSNQAIRHRLYRGESWGAICDEIIEALPQHVYISFDIDGLDPKLCPNTGTPVPGGFELQETFFLLRRLIESGRKIIAFDLVEVAPGEDDWDGNVGARVLFKLSHFLLQSHPGQAAAYLV